MSLIDCNETLRKIEQIPFIANENKAFHEGCRYMQKKVLRVLHESKFVDVVPIKHGYWTRVEVYGKDCFGNSSRIHLSSKCSICGHGTPLDSPDYCPNCGAKMDGGIY